MAGDTLRRTVRQLNAVSGELKLLNQEMQHRIQNGFGVVMALVRTSRATDLAEFRQDILGRVLALSNASRVLLSKTETGAAVDDLVTQAIAPFQRADEIRVEGRARLIPAEAGQQLLLILHELCTNALKHGALSQSQGQVRISWTDDGMPFQLEWLERGGPAVSPPTRKGLGSRLFSSQRVFDVSLQFNPTGVQCVVRLQLVDECA